MELSQLYHIMEFYYYIREVIAEIALKTINRSYGSYIYELTHVSQNLWLSLSPSHLTSVYNKHLKALREGSAFSGCNMGQTLTSIWDGNDVSREPSTMTQMSLTQKPNKKPNEILIKNEIMSRNSSYFFTKNLCLFLSSSFLVFSLVLEFAFIAKFHR